MKLNLILLLACQFDCNVDGTSYIIGCFKLIKSLIVII